MNIKKAIPQKLKNYFHALDSTISNIRYGFPSKKLTVIGITGTDGKTTTSNLLYQIFLAAGKKVGLISSINAKFGDKEFPLKFHVTTPDPKDIMQILSQMVAEGIEYVVLETTSHALDQFRVGSIKYSACGYTNITKEHLDYHKTFEEYRMAKSRLISQTKKGGFVILNADDSSFEFLSKKATKQGLKVISYGIKNKADIVASNITKTDKTQMFNINTKAKISLPLPGEYNIYNTLAAISLAQAFGIEAKHIENGVSNTKVLNGRWEIMQESPFKVIVDFAHTPNALQNALINARESIENKGKVHVVFGCAGRRDFTKRPVMGEIAGRLADYTYVTAEDPRDEKLSDISASIAKGLKQAGRKENEDYFIIPDRAKAIEKAIGMAKNGDIVLITGKGHELSMNLDGKTEIPWSDQKIVKELIKK